MFKTKVHVPASACIHGTQHHHISHLTELEPEEPVRHWCPFSEKYTGGDALLNALECGWEITGIIFRQDFWYGAGRQVSVYHFTLCRDHNLVKMKVVESPWVLRFVNTQTSAQVVLLNLRKDNGDERWSDMTTAPMASAS